MSDQVARDGRSGSFAWKAGASAGVLVVLVVVVVFLIRNGALPSFVKERGGDMTWADEVQRRNSTGHETAEAVVATASGFSVVGYTNSAKPGVQQAWVLQFAEAATPSWQRTYGNGLGALGRAVASTPGGQLVVAGEEMVSPDRFKGWLLALSENGNIRWERTFGHAGFNGFTAVTALGDGSIVAGGVQDGMGWVVRVDPEGQVLWEELLPRIERVTGVVALARECLAVVGTADSSTTGLGIAWVLLLGLDGRTAQVKRLPVEGRGELAALAPLSEGGLVAVGRKAPPDSIESKLWLVRLDPRGDLLWERSPDGTPGEAGRAVTALPEGGFAVVGYSWKAPLVDREAKVWLFSADGSLLWQKTFGGAEDDQGNGIARLADGSLLVVGSTMSRGAGKTDLWTFRVSLEGKLLWEETFGRP